MKLAILSFTLLFCFESAFSQTFDTLRRNKALDFMIQAVKAENDYLFENAISLIDSAIFLDSNYHAPYTIKSEALWMLKRYGEAAESYKKAISLGNDTTFLFGAYVLLGILYEKANQIEEAQKQYLKAVYLFETKKRSDDRLFENVNRIDYAIALCLSRNKLAWEKTLNAPQNKKDFQIYEGKSRKEVLEIYFKQYGG